jgi:hypothetical protein
MCTLKGQVIQITNAAIAATSSPLLSSGKSASLGVPTEREILLLDVTYEKGRLSEWPPHYCDHSDCVV